MTNLIDQQITEAYMKNRIKELERKGTLSDEEVIQLESLYTDLDNLYTSLQTNA